MRLDQYLVQLDKFTTRNQAQEAIKDGIVYVNQKQVKKPAFDVCEDDVVEVLQVSRYVSRSGEKLAGALKTFNINPVNKVCLDIGASTKEDALKVVRLGDTATFISEFVLMGDETIKAKALDDRVGCAVLISMIKNYDEYDFYAIFTVQEEVGCRGARTAAFSVSPDFAICLEATTAADISGVADEDRVCILGQGPAVSFMDKATIYDRALYDEALSLDVKKQTKAAVAGGNNSGAVHLSKEGVRTIALSVPCRYIHTGSCVCNISDIKNLEKLATKLCSKICSGEIK